MHVLRLPVMIWQRLHALVILVVLFLAMFQIEFRGNTWQYLMRKTVTGLSQKKISLPSHFLFRVCPTPTAQDPLWSFRRVSADSSPPAQPVVAYAATPSTSVPSDLQISNRVSFIV